jgi:hypothetical protein
MISFAMSLRARALNRAAFAYAPSGAASMSMDDLDLLAL